MMKNNCCNIYETASLCGERGGPQHPGGLELTAEAIENAALPAGARVLDLGCGSGMTVEWLIDNGFRAEGIDVSVVLVEEGQSRGLPLKAGKSDSLPYEDSIFDAVLLECTLSVFGQRGKTLDEIFRVLKPDGKLIISDFYILPGSKDDRLTLSLITCLNGILTQKLLKEELAGHGFPLLKFKDMNHAYKRLLFDIIMEHGSLDSFWQGLCSGAVMDSRTDLRGNKLSYFYGIWHKGHTGIIGDREHLIETESLCPVCLKKIGADIVARGGEIFMEKTCPEHGFFQIKIWQGKEDFLRWSQNVKSGGMHIWDNLAVNGCPFDCGICPEHEQDACCVLIEVTNRCDQKCRFCFANAGRNQQEKGISEIRELLRFLLARSMERPYNIQISGGEPTIREDLPEIIRLVKELGFPYVQINTNGLRLAKEPGYAQKLKDSGLDSVFLQFDGTKDNIYEEIRGQKLFDIKKEAIDNCRQAELGVVLVMTLVPGINTKNIGATIDFMLEGLPHLRGVHFQPVSYFGRYPFTGSMPRHFTLSDLLLEIALGTDNRISAADFLPLETGHPLCSFHGNFLLDEKDGKKEIVSVSAPRPCCSAKTDIVKAREYIRKKWGQYHSENTEQKYQTASWDGFLHKIDQKGFSISAMAFQDAWNVDLERLRRCRVYVAEAPNRLIPFCAYNMTDIEGVSIYRK